LKQKLENKKYKAAQVERERIQDKKKSSHVSNCEPPYEKELQEKLPQYERFAATEVVEAMSRATMRTPIVEWAEARDVGARPRGALDLEDARAWPRGAAGAGEHRGRHSTRGPDLPSSPSPLFDPFFCVC